MNKDDRVIRDTFLTDYSFFKRYEQLSENADGKNNESEENKFERFDIMENVEGLYRVAKKNAELISPDPEKFGFKKEEFDNNINDIDYIVMRIYEEREPYFPSTVN